MRRWRVTTKVPGRYRQALNQALTSEGTGRGLPVVCRKKGIGVLNQVAILGNRSIRSHLKD